MDAVEIVALIRDIVIIAVMVMAFVTLGLLYLSFSKLLKKIRRTADNISEVSEKLLKPATAGSGAAFALGKIGSFVSGFATKKRGKEGGNENG